MTDQPLEPKAWDGRWLAIAFVKPTKETPAHYMLYEVQRAANHSDAAQLAQSKWGLQNDTHLMVVALSAEISILLMTPTADLEAPGARWFKVSWSNQFGLRPDPAPGATLRVQQESEDAWLREIRTEWTYKEPPAPTPAPATAAADGQE